MLKTVITFIFFSLSSLTFSYEHSLRVFSEMGVPKAPLEKALRYIHENSDQVKNQEYLTLIDFSQHSSSQRLYLLDLIGETVTRMQVSHGKGSDPNNTGYATEFSNIENSHMSSLGLYLTAETYYGGNGYSLRLDGLEVTNSLARQRYIVVHGADYIDEETNRTGRSLGCPAVDMKYHVELIDKIKNQSILYIFR